MRQLPKDSQKIIDGWPEHLGVQERAAQLGWLGPFTPDEWAVLTWNSYAHRLYLSDSGISPARERVRKAFADTLDDLHARVELATIRHEQAVQAEVRLQSEGFAQQVQGGRRPLQVGEALIVNLPDTGEVDRARTALEMAISDRADCERHRDADEFAEFARENVTPICAQGRVRKGLAHAATEGVRRARQR